MGHLELVLVVEWASRVVSAWQISGGQVTWARARRSVDSGKVRRVGQEGEGVDHPQQMEL